MSPSSQTLQIFPFSLWVKVKVLNMTWHSLVSLPSLTILPTLLSLTHCSPDTVGFLLVLENCRPILVTRSLYLLPLPGRLFPTYPHGLLTYLPPSGHTSNVTFSVRLSLTTHLKFQLFSSSSHSTWHLWSHFPSLIVPILYITMWHLYLFTSLFMTFFFPLECELYEGRDFCLICLWIYSGCLDERRAHDKCVISFYWIN